MNRRNSLQLRSSKQVLSPVKRTRSLSLERQDDFTSDREYERKRKQQWRDKKSGGLKNKRGPKTKIGIKDMSPDELKKYERERKRIQREKKKSQTTEEIDFTAGHDEEDLEEDVVMVSSIETTRQTVEKESETILRIVNSPSKKRNMPRQIARQVQEKLQNLDETEVLDVLVALAHTLPQPGKDISKEMGVCIRNLPKSSKRHIFSAVSTSRKHRFKDDLLDIMNQYNNVTSAHCFVRIVLNSTDLTEDLMTGLNTNGIEMTQGSVSPSMRMSVGLRKVVESICSKDSKCTSGKVEIIANAVKEGNMSTTNKGDVHSVATTFGISDKFSKRIIDSIEKGEEMSSVTKRAGKSNTIAESEWPETIKSFCLMKPICREAPGETVSVSYGVRAEKYIRQFSVGEIFNLFRIKYPEFPFQLTTFRQHIPKNLVAASLRDVKRNTCPLHENVKRSVSAFNRYVVKNKAKELRQTSSTIDICLKGICKQSDDPTENRNPLHWKSTCTKGFCLHCGFEKWLANIKASVEAKGLQEKTICYSRWVTEREGKKNQVILVKKTCSIIKFIDTVLIESFSTSKYNFAEHLRKAWTQWEISKHSLIVLGVPGDVAIRSREDYQEDIKFLSLSETVSTHRGAGVITMVCYPVVLEIFHTDGRQELHGVIFMSDTKDKCYHTVYYLALAVLEYVINLGYTIKRYDRISDGCSSQFWCWGTYTYIQRMTSIVHLINFHRYERYEGKNMSDALGSMVKRRMKESALQQRMVGLDSSGINAILDDANDDTNMDDLVFQNHKQAFDWLDMCMDKGNDKFSAKFDAVKLFWKPASSIPECLLVEKDVRKIPKIKSFNCLTAMAGIEGVFVSDASCNSCEQCRSGEVFACSNVQGSAYVKHSTVKNKTMTGATRRTAKCDTGDSSGEESEPELVYESELDESFSESDHDSDSEEVPSTTSPLTQGLYVLYKDSTNAFSVGCVTECFPDSRAVKFARKYGVRNNEVTFIWPEDEDIQIIENIKLQEDAIALPDPNTTRRGSVKFRKDIFHNIQISTIN